jgi:TonB family protein
MIRWVPLTLLAFALTVPLSRAQSAAPILTAPPNIVYPPIAKAAHVSGDVTVTFAINPDGTTTSVQAVSGPPMLIGAVVDRIKHWTFKTPLPLNSQTYFEAKYSFIVKTSDDDEEDNLDTPPYIPSGGDVIVIQPGANTITGDVHSTDGSQVIDVTATPAAKAQDRCPKDPQKTPPDKTDFSDYIELLRHDCDQGCPSYRVRIYRNGRVTWNGFNDVAAKGDREALIDAGTADTLLDSFQSEEFWASCSVPPPPDPKPHTKADAEDDITGMYLAASIGGLTKTIDERGFNNTYAWSIDRTADTHRWRHVDAATEPYDNMREDLTTPKPGMTLLIRATHHFNPYTGQQTFTYLDKLLKRGEPVDAADASGWTALMYASYLDSYQSGSTEGDPIKLLLDARADPNRASLHGDTALMFAAYRGTLLQPLLAHGADINAHNADGVTALMLLAQGGDPTEQLQQALTAGADPTAHDSRGRTAFDYLTAASCGKPIIPLAPFSGGGMIAQVIPKNPPPCPDTSNKSFLASQALLQKAMAAKTTQPAQ